MRKVIYLISLLCLWLCVPFVSAAGTNDWVFPGLLSQLNQGLNRLSSSSRYQVNLELVDQGPQATLVKGTILVDQAARSVFMQLFFYPLHEDSRIAVADSMVSGPIPPPTPPLRVEVAIYGQEKEAYARLIRTADAGIGPFIPLAQFEASPEMLSHLPQAFLYLPNSNVLNEVKANQLYYKNGLIQLHAQRIHIPFFLFKQSQGIEIRLKDLTINQTQAVPTGFLQLRPDKGLGVTVDLPADEDNWMGHDRDRLTTAFDTQQTTDKLTDVDITFNPDTLVYQARLKGLVQIMEFNLFSDLSADFKSRNYILKVRIEPTDRIIPAKQALGRDPF